MNYKIKCKYYENIKTTNVRYPLDKYCKKCYIIIVFKVLLYMINSA